MKQTTRKKQIPKKKQRISSRREEDFFLRDDVELWTPVRFRGKLYGYCREVYRPTFVTKLFFNGGDLNKLKDLEIFHELKAAVPKSTAKNPARIRDLDKMVFIEE